MADEAVDVAVIGGGPAGLAAATAAKEHGSTNVVIIDRNSWLGGILPQCIHDGFGLEETGESMTGPEYAERHIKMAKKQHVAVIKETMVLQLNRKKEILAVNKQGIHNIRANAIVLAMGCREKTRWHALIPGDRPSGIFTAGMAQAFINLYNIMPGKNVVILGSGDVGLIMARRLKFEGANVLGVVEILPHASGLPRNVVQCLDDYDIPLFLNHTVTFIKGKERVEQVTIAQVDEHMAPIAGTEQDIICDTLLLSLGLVPENELSKQATIKIDSATGGPVVNQHLETSVDGIFACGNCLQVYDVVDMLSHDAKKAGKYAARYKPKKPSKKAIPLVAGKGVRQVVPQKITEVGKTEITVRSEKIQSASTLRVLVKSKEIFKKKLPFVNPANMIKTSIDIDPQIIASRQSLEVMIDD
ncbi:MAG: FAD-dependent oxidoreductase [Candidatus Thermoplasmatota archaeon]|nr:FAD-dependent oxidoreductase [Candidatus Thermoplasmatota archaeon]